MSSHQSEKKTYQTTVKYGETIWDALSTIATERDANLSTTIREILEDYLLGAVYRVKEREKK